MLSFDHANSAGTGSQLVVDIEKSEDGNGGFVVLTIRPQTSLPEFDSSGRRRAYAQFGSMADATACLTAKQIVHILGVLEGRADSVLGGKGLYSCNDGAETVVHADKMKERPFGYALHIRVRQDGDVFDQRIVINQSEALAIAKAVNSVFGMLAFGDFR